MSSYSSFFSCKNNNTLKVPKNQSSNQLPVSPREESSISSDEGFNDWGGRGYDDFVPGEVTRTAPFGDETI